MRHLHTLAVVPLLLSLLCCVASAESSPSPSPTPASGSAVKTGLEGVITRSPIHGGPVRQGVPSSAPLPNTTFVVRKTSAEGAAEVARFTTDAEGRYSVALPPGKYEVVARESKGRIGRYGPFPVDVVAGKMTTQNFDCDTGLR